MIVRLDAYMAEYWPENSRSTWQKYIEAGRVKVNGQMIISVKFLVREDDEVSYDQPAALSFEGDTLPVIYEDDHVLVIDKPVGILTHAKGAVTEEFSVAEFVRPRMNELDETNRPGIVHRLDRATSGVIIVAKDSQAKHLLQKQFQDRKAHKTYLAITESTPKLLEAEINLPIGRDPKQPSRFRVDAKGKPAVTYYKVIESFSNGQSLIELKPHTGRTHQLRVHLAYIGAPILGDPIYGNGKPQKRMYLHAKELEITIPGDNSGQRKIFSAPIPIEFTNLIEENRGSK